MSDVVTSGFPAIAPTGESVAGITSSGRAFGAWEWLLLALDRPQERVLHRGGGRGVGPVWMWRTSKAGVTLPRRAITPTTLKWSRHAADAVRVILGLDTLYANER